MFQGFSAKKKLMHQNRQTTSNSGRTVGERKGSQYVDRLVSILFLIPGKQKRQTELKLDGR